MLYPAIRLAMNDEEPREKITPMKMDTPWNAGDWEPGMYGYATTMANATVAKRTMRYVGQAHSRSNLANVMLPLAMPAKSSRTSLRKYRVTSARRAMKIRLGTASSTAAAILPSGPRTRLLNRRESGR